MKLTDVILTILTICGVFFIIEGVITLKRYLKRKYGRHDAI